MNKRYQKYLSMLAGLLLVLSAIVPVASAESVEHRTPQEKTADLIGKTLGFYEQARYLEETFGYPPQELSWTEVVALRATSTQLTDGTAQLPGWVTKDPELKPADKDTKHIRYIYGLLAAGKNPSDAWETKRNLYAELAAQQNEVGSFGGVNKQAWSILALNAGKQLGHEVGTWNTASQQRALTSLLNEEIPGGGFSLAGSKGEPDPDMTAMVLLALAEYQQQPDVREAIGRAKKSLRDMQYESGGWGAYKLEDANSTATVISGLLAIGEDAASPAWSKSGITPLDALAKFQLENGGFSYMKGEEMPVNLKATEQALVALQEIKDGQSVWQQLADPTSTNTNPSIQLPHNVEKTIKNGMIHFRIKDMKSGEWKPAKVEKKLLIGEYMTIQIKESATVTQGTPLPAGDKRIVVLDNNVSYTYFEADKFTPSEKEWEVKFSAPLLDTPENLKNVTVRNADGEIVSAEVTVQADNMSVKVVPDHYYNPGALYYITISDVLSAKEKVVKEPIRKVFVIEKY